MTEMNKRWIRDHPEYLDSILQRTPLARLGNVDEIANATLWLLSDEASYATGAILDVSGGFVTP